MNTEFKLSFVGITGFILCIFGGMSLDTDTHYNAVFIILCIGLFLFGADLIRETVRQKRIEENRFKRMLEREKAKANRA